MVQTQETPQMEIIKLYWIFECCKKLILMLLIRQTYLYFDALFTKQEEFSAALQR